MSTKVYLGYPPPNVRTWIENKYRKTVITFDNGDEEEYDWSGEVNKTTLIEAGILEDGSYAWIKNPVSIRFGTTVTTIGEYAFYYCNSLTSVSMPNVTQIGNSAFSGCSYLTSVSMPNVTTVDVYAFDSCTNLTSVLMSNVVAVGGRAFRSCPYLTSVSMPNVNTVGEYAFSECPNLASVSMPNETIVNGCSFAFVSGLVEFKNQTTSTISEWFGNQVFGEQWGPVTVTCSDGSVRAEWDDSENKWNTEITPAQQ